MTAGRACAARLARRRAIPAAMLLLLGLASPSAAFTLTVEAPPELEAVARRLRTFDSGPLGAALGERGLELPARVRVELLSESHPLARESPQWVVASASGVERIVIFPARVGSYPYNSLESVLRHEIAHLALNHRADGRGLPRWFHEGVAVDVEQAWIFGLDLRLLLGAASSPAMADLRRLFESDAPLATADAYRMAAALVADVRRRHGPATPGAVAGRVALGVPFGEAFRSVTGETPDDAAATAWAVYRRGTTWLAILTSASTIWMGVIVLAFVAAVIRLRKRAKRRRQWNDEEGDMP